MLSIVTWKWAAPAGYRTQFTSRHVNILRRMVARHYHQPHRFICVTNHPEGLDAEIEAIRDEADFAQLPNATDVAERARGKRRSSMRPSCYRRLRAFHPDAGAVFGDRFVLLDLDTVIVRDITPLWDRDDDCVLYREPGYQQYNGSMILLRAGARPTIWTDFAPESSCAIANQAGFRGSDQAWVSYCLWPRDPCWTQRDGVYSYIKDRLNGRLPKDARMVMFHGGIDPWSTSAQGHAWVREHWH